MTTQNIVRAIPRTFTRDEARDFLSKVSGPPCKELVGKEYNDIWLLLQLITPYTATNCQRSLTEEYLLGGKIYHVTYGITDNPIIQELVENDI